MNEILPYREKPLSAGDYQKIQAQIKKYFRFEPRQVGRSVPVKDHDGNIYRWEHDLVPDGYDLIALEQPPPALVDAMARPATAAAIKEHLFVLSRMKRYTGGDAGLYIIAREIHRHLPDCSEFALMKACDDFALDKSSPWFPDPAAFIDAVKKIQEKIEGVRAGHAEQHPAHDPDPAPEPETPEHRAKVADVGLKVAMRQELTGEEKAFWEGIAKK